MIDGPILAGYALVYGELQKPISAGGRPLVFRTGSYRPTARNLQLCFAHDRSYHCAATGRGTMAVWADEIGVAFAASPAGPHGRWIVNAVARREMDACSIWLEAGARLAVESIGDTECDVVTSFSIGEISITHRGADPLACVWLADADRAELPGRTRRLASHWNASWRTHAECIGSAPACARGVANASAWQAPPRAEHRIARSVNHAKPTVPDSMKALMSSPDWQRLSARPSNQHATSKAARSVTRLLAAERPRVGQIVGHALTTPNTVLNVLTNERAPQK